MRILQEPIVDVEYDGGIDHYSYHPDIDVFAFLWISDTWNSEKTYSEKDDSLEKGVEAPLKEDFGVEKFLIYPLLV